MPTPIASDTGSNIAPGNPQSGAQANPGRSVERRERIVEIGTVVKDPCLPPDRNQVVAEYTMEEVSDLGVLGEKPMWSDVEAAAVERQCAAQAPDLTKALEHGYRRATVHTLVCGRKSGGPPSHDYNINGHQSSLSPASGTYDALRPEEPH